MAEVVTPSDVVSWHHNPVTKQFIADLKASRQDVLEAWGRQVFVNEHPQNTLQLNAKGLAQIETIDQLLGNLERGLDEAREALEERA